MSKRMRTAVDHEGNVISFIADPEFRSKARLESVLSAGIQRLKRRGSLSGNDELVLFKAYHAAGYAVNLLANGGKLPKRTLKQVSQLRRQLLEYIVNENIGLVHEMRRRSPVTYQDADDLISEGLWTLFRAAAGFDPWRGFRFSTYACRSLLRAYQAIGKKRTRESDNLNRSRLHFEETEAAKPPPPDLDTQLHVERLRQVLSENTAGLTPVERMVLDRRVLNPPTDRPETLVALGEVLDLSKEGVRQIQLAAIEKLRSVIGGTDQDEPLRIRSTAA